MTLVELFTNTANAIRDKDGSTDKITPEDFPARIRAISGGGTSADYTELQYIESNGVQYIDTGIYPDYQTNIEVSYCRTGNMDYGWEAPFGSRDSVYNYVFWDKAEESPLHKATQYGNSVYARFDVQESNFNVDTIVGISNSSYYLIYGNNSINVSKTGALKLGAISSISMFLFANNTDGNLDSPSCMKLYYCKIWQKNKLVRDFIPCKDPSGIVCLYDKVSRTYFYNKGTGVFEGGNL